MASFFSVKGFERFQHYKDRSPPWIKLYNALLDDYEFGCLQDASKMHLVAIWLLASRSDNKVPRDPAWIAKRINATDPVDLDALEAAGFIITIQDDTPVLQVASAPQAKRLTRERDREETEKNKKGKDAVRSRALPVQVSPSDPVLNGSLPDWRVHNTEQEIAVLQFRFDPLPVADLLPELWDWSAKEPKINERKRMVYRALEKRHAELSIAPKLIADMENPQSVQTSDSLRRSRLAQSDRRSRASAA